MGGGFSPEVFLGVNLVPLTGGMRLSKGFNSSSIKDLLALL